MKFVFVGVVSLFVCGVGLAEPQTGLIADLPIDTKFFATTKEYYKERAKSLHRLESIDR